MAANTTRNASATSGQTTVLERAFDEDAAFGPFEEITPADRERYSTEFRNMFPSLAAILDGTTAR